MLLTGCATLQLPEVVVQPVSQYRLFQSKEGLVVSIDPFLEKRRVKELFGINLLSKGILPVLIVVENRSTDATFWLQKELSSLEMLNIKSIGKQVVTSSLEQGEIGMGEKVLTGVVAGVGAVVPAVAIIGGPVVIIVAKSEANRQIIMQNLIKKELKERTITSGQSQHGFLYFKLPDKTAIETISAIQLKAMNLQKRETLTFHFSIK